MGKLIPDEMVDRVRITPAKVDRSARSIGVVEAAPELVVLSSALGFFNWSEMMYVSSGVLGREGIGTNNTGFRYPTDELDPGEEPLEGVEVYNPLGELQLSIPAFERLMARYFRALITGAEEHGDEVTRQPWWPEFVARTEQIERRLELPS